MAQGADRGADHGELAREAGLNVPEIVQVDIGAALGRNEPDEEIRDLLSASVGANLGIGYLPLIPTTGVGSDRMQLQWMGRDGRLQDPVGEPAEYTFGSPMLSLDGRHAAMCIVNSTNGPLAPRRTSMPVP